MARIYNIYGVYTVFLAGNHQIYGHIRCIYTVLANPTNDRAEAKKEDPCAHIEPHIQCVCACVRVCVLMCYKCKHTCLNAAHRVPSCALPSYIEGTERQSVSRISSKSSTWRHHALVTRHRLACLQCRRSQGWPTLQLCLTWPHLLFLPPLPILPSSSSPFSHPKPSSTAGLACLLLGLHACCCCWCGCWPSVHPLPPAAVAAAGWCGCCWLWWCCCVCC